MDEPLSNLDAKLRVSMRAELKHLSHMLQITTVYVTHDQIEAMTLADRVAVMNNGVIQQLGTPEAIYNDPQNLFVAGFIGSPAMNLIHGRIENGKFFTAGGFAVTDIEGPSRDELVLGIRPEDLSVKEVNQGDFDAPVYAFENTGESVQITCQFNKQRIIAKGDRYLTKEIDEPVGMTLDKQHIYLFDAKSGERLPK